MEINKKISEIQPQLNIVQKVKGQKSSIKARIKSIKDFDSNSTTLINQLNSTHILCHNQLYQLDKIPLKSFIKPSEQHLNVIYLPHLYSFLIVISI